MVSIRSFRFSQGKESDRIFYTMAQDFYDKVAQKFGGYHTDSRYTTIYPGEQPEEVFKQKLLEQAGAEKSVLDLGCADGRFTLSLAPNFKQVTAIDISEGMLLSARNLQENQQITNVDFVKQHAEATTFSDGQFDVVYSRRGPTPYAEVFRILKPGGSFIIIEIGEKDCVEIKKVFGRGQNYGGWDKPRSKRETDKAEEVGFEVEFIENYYYNEYYKSYKDFDLFLQGVPIFEDFDPVTDKVLLETYVQKFETEQGIRLERHRVVFTLTKPLL